MKYLILSMYTACTVLAIVYIHHRAMMKIKAIVGDKYVYKYMSLIASGGIDPDNDEITRIVKDTMWTWSIFAILWFGITIFVLNELDMY